MQKISALILSGAVPNVDKEKTGRLFSNEKFIIKSQQIISMDFPFFLDVSQMLAIVKIIQDR
jgi:hypothetical protein